MKKYDIFLMDADGTLFDFEKAEANAMRSMFERRGFCYSNDILMIYRGISSLLWEEFEKGAVSSSELQFERFARLFNAIGISYDARKFNAEYLVELGKGSFLIDGANEICEKIAARGKRIYIVTNGILIPQKSRIERSLIKDFISGYFVSEAIGYQKPHALYFKHVFSSIPNFDMSETLIVGDSLSADIAGGINAGIDSCWFNRSRKSNETGIIPTYEIQELSELRVFI